MALLCRGSCKEAVGVEGGCNSFLSATHNMLTLEKSSAHMELLQGFRKSQALLRAEAQFPWP